MYLLRVSHFKLNLDGEGDGISEDRDPPVFGHKRVSDTSEQGMVVYKIANGGERITKKQL